MTEKRIEEESKYKALALLERTLHDDDPHRVPSQLRLRTALVILVWGTMQSEMSTKAPLARGQSTLTGILR